VTFLKLFVVDDTPMGVHRNFSRGDNADVLLILFQVAKDAAQMDVHKTLYPFYIPKKIPQESTCSIRILFELVLRCSSIQGRNKRLS